MRRTRQAPCFSGIESPCAWRRLNSGTLVAHRSALSGRVDATGNHRPRPSAVHFVSFWDETDALREVKLSPQELKVEWLRELASPAFGDFDESAVQGSVSDCDQRVDDGHEVTIRLTPIRRVGIDRPLHSAARRTSAFTIRTRSWPLRWTV